MQIKPLLIAFIVFTGTLKAQIACHAVLLDSATKQPIEFANVGIPNKGIGTVTNEKGEFNFNVPDSLSNAKVRVSIIGYTSKVFTAKNLQSKKTVLLSQNAVALNEVKVSAKKLKKKILGNHTTTRAVSLGFMSAQLGSELAVRINVKHPKTQLRKFMIHINDTLPEKPVFRFNVYKIASNGFPGENILAQNILIEAKDKTGLVEADLMPYNLFVDDDVFIAIEWIKDLTHGKNRPVFRQACWNFDLL